MRSIKAILDEQQICEIEKVAKKLRISRSALISRLIDAKIIHDEKIKKGKGKEPLLVPAPAHNSPKILSLSIPFYQWKYLKKKAKSKKYGSIVGVIRAILLNWRGGWLDPYLPQPLRWRNDNNATKNR